MQLGYEPVMSIYDVAAEAKLPKSYT
jgi:hypothetical protein